MCLGLKDRSMIRSLVQSCNYYRKLNRMGSLERTTAVVGNRTTPVQQYPSFKRSVASIHQNAQGDTRLFHPKPLIVLLGWLGSKPRTLNRYVELYDTLGCQVIIRILPPAMVIHSAHTPLSPLPRDIDHLLSSSSSAAAIQNHKEPCNITDIAVDILQEVTARHYPNFVIHNFSNGGCFLWEKIYQILTSQSQTQGKSPINPKDDRVHGPISTLKEKLMGVVFDSSPAAYHARPNLLDSAIMYVPTLERLQLKLQMLTQQWFQGKASMLETSKRRSMEYWNTMMFDNLNIPQLYIYSTMDHLTDWEELEKLIHHRRGHLGEQMIQSLRFEDSRHCSHLLRHPSEYKQTTQSFLDMCISRILERENQNTIPLLSKL